MDLKITADEIRSLCMEVTDQQRQFCAEHRSGSDFPERVLRQSTKDPAVEFDASPISVEDFWGIIMEYERVESPGESSSNEVQ